MTSPLWNGNRGDLGMGDWTGPKMGHLTLHTHALRTKDARLPPRARAHVLVVLCPSLRDVSDAHDRKVLTVRDQTCVEDEHALHATGERRRIASSPRHIGYLARVSGPARPKERRQGRSPAPHRVGTADRRAT